MEKMNFSIEINATPEKVWESLWSDEGYRRWTAPFAPGSHAKSDWKEGSKVLFLSGEGSGMVSRVERNIPYEYMSFKHLGQVAEGGEEDTDSERVKEWAGAMENYRLEQVGDTTKLHVDVDVTEQDKPHMEKAFPSALSALKEMVETDR